MRPRHPRWHRRVPALRPADGGRGQSGRAAPLAAARETDLGPYAELLDSERLVGNLHRAYAELEGAAPGAVIDLAAAFVDMVAYNGGRPLRCLA